MTRELDLVNFETAHLPPLYNNCGETAFPYRTFTPEERHRAAVEAGWNVFRFPAQMVEAADLLSDSGTTMLTKKQRESLSIPHYCQSYGSSESNARLQQAVENTFGTSRKDWRVDFYHQCRPAEHALYSHIKGMKVVPSNGFFDTTRANAQANDIIPLDIPDASMELFKGNIDLESLETALKKYRRAIPFVLMTITNNTCGGQPVSMCNLKQAAALAHAHGTSLFLDACRFAENAWFIKEREEGCGKKPIPDIVREMIALCDGFTISFKKDGMAHMGGALVLKKDSPFTKRFPNILEDLYDHQIETEGHNTQGGIPEMVAETIVVGLEHVVTEKYLRERITQVRNFGTYMHELGVPVVTPFGGHAVYVNLDEFFANTKMRREDFGGIALTALLLLTGVRGCELGAFAFGEYDQKTGTETFHGTNNLLRLAVPRGRYSDDELLYAADRVFGLYERRHELPKATPTYGREKSLRHFKARFELKYD